MFGEERIEDKFSTYRGRMEFVRELLAKTDNKVNEDDLRRISELLGVSNN